MYNSFIFKKHSQQLERENLRSRNNKIWMHNYKNSVRPALVEKYSRRINNFIVRLEEEKKDFYEYRQETESKARELLKEIESKERYLGDPTIKLRDNSDWVSMLSPTERIEKQRNKRMFQTKYGDSEIAYRSIASQSAYMSVDSVQFRTRDKHKEIHNHNMRFSSKSRSFHENKRQKNQPKSKASNHVKTEGSKDAEIHRSISNRSYNDDQIRSQAFSMVSFADHVRAANDEDRSSVSNHKEAMPKLSSKSNNANNKVYFKQIVDLQQHSNDPSIKKNLHQILVRFGMSRIKDIKKQAMMETDILESDAL